MSRHAEAHAARIRDLHSRRIEMWSRLYAVRVRRCGLCGHPLDAHEGWAHVGSSTLTPHQAAYNAASRLDTVTGDFGGNPNSPLGYIWYPREGEMRGVNADLVVFDEHLEIK